MSSIRPSAIDDVLALEKPKAQERQKAHGGTAPGKKKNTQETVSEVLPEPDGSPGCGHDLCLFERRCLCLQADAELAAAITDNAHRRNVAALLCRYLGLADDLVPVLIVMMYSPSTVARIRAGKLLQDELLEMAA